MCLVSKKGRSIYSAVQPASFLLKVYPPNCVTITSASVVMGVLASLHTVPEKEMYRPYYRTFLCTTKQLKFKLHKESAPVERSALTIV